MGQRSRHTMGRGLALVVALSLFLSPLAYLVHLVAEPHFFCSVHQRFEAEPSHPNDGRKPADPKDHDNEDSPCLLAAGHGGEDVVSVPHQVQVHPLALAGAILPCQQVAVSCLCLWTQAPKHSPPVLSV